MRPIRTVRQLISRLRTRLTTPRRRNVPVGKFDVTTGRWTDVDAAGDVNRDELTLATFNVWNASDYAEQRYLAIANLLSQRTLDIMVFQEVTPAALNVFLAQPWIRNHYLRAAITGGDVGDYGMLILSRLPITRVTYTRLPSRQSRGFLQVDFLINGKQQAVCCVHLDSGKSASRLRARQLRAIFRSLQTAEDAALLGDFNMRDAENARIAAPYCDVWPALRPDDDGFTEDTSINLMRFDMKNKHRRARFDRVLLKGPHWTAAEIKLLGTEPISTEHPRVFPSDHFGVGCRLISRNPSGVPPVPPQTGRRPP